MTQQQVRSSHPYFMYDAIQEQPSAVSRMLQEHEDGAVQAARILAEKRRIYLVGIGTSWHAALIAQHWFRCFATGEPEVQAWHSFEFVAYPPPLDESSAAIIISHRGTKTYSFEVLDLAKARGAMTLAITSTDPGPRIMGADVHIRTVEQERSAAFTVSYTSALTILGMLACEMGVMKGIPDADEQLSQLAQVPHAIQRALDDEELVKAAAARFSDQERYLFTGWGPNEATAYEVALKMKETSYTPTEGFQLEQLLHGPFVATTSGSLLTMVAPPGPGYDRALDVARAASELGTPVWALVEEGDEVLSILATEAFTLGPVTELWSPLVYVVPLQLFTYHLALARGCNPDVFHLDDEGHAAARKHYTL